MTTTVEEITCLDCKAPVGTVTAVETKPGFFSNSCTPSPMPARCPLCQGTLIRTPGGVT